MAVSNSTAAFRLLCRRQLSNGSTRISVTRYSSYEEAMDAFETSKTKTSSLYVLQRECDSRILVVSFAGEDDVHYDPKCGVRRRLFYYFHLGLLLTPNYAEKLYGKNTKLSVD